MGQNIVDIDEKLRIIGTAHVSTASVALVREEIEGWKPDLVAVELYYNPLWRLNRGGWGWKPEKNPVLNYSRLSR